MTSLSRKKANLQITDKGVVAVQEFNLDIADKEFIVLVGSVRLRQIDDAAHDRRSRGDH